MVISFVNSAAMERERERESGKCMDPQLWHACAGGTVQMPPVHSKVYYFPQGHAEHAQSPVELPSGRVPALVLCHVAAVRFMADPDTDEVFAKIRLAPVCPNEADDDAFGAAASAQEFLLLGEGRERPTRSFAKTLTQADANNGGGFSMPRYCAETILPRLDYSADPPVQTVLAKDVHGVVWKFRHIYRGTPRRHLLTTGWSTFVNQKKLVAGDSIVFMRTENGDLCVGIRRAKKGGIGGPGSMFLRGEEDGSKMMAAWGNVRVRVRPEEVVEASNLAVSGQPFEVVYYPRASTPEFCVKAGAVRAAMRTQWCAGMRFKMAFETEDSSRINWFMGTVSDVQVADPIRWPNSPWRLLQVRWDESSIFDPVQNLSRVSPWKIEPVSAPPAPLLLSAELRFPTNQGTKHPRMDIDSVANYRPLRPRLVVCTASSSSSGSISTTYTSGSSQLQSSSDQGGSSPSAMPSMSFVEEIRNKLEHVQLPWLELAEEEREKTREDIKSLVQEFSTTSNSALVLERWFSDLGVSWVLTITGDEIFRRRLQHFARSWIAALAVIQVFIFAYLDGSRNQDEGGFFPSDSEFARFLLSTYLKILGFVDSIVTMDVIDPDIESNVEATEPAEERLQALIGVRDALSATSEQIQLWPHPCTPFVGSGGVIDEVSNLLSEKLAKLDEVVWDTVDEIRTSITTSLTDSHGLESQTSLDIHLVTRSVTSCIKVLSNNYGLVHQIVSKAVSHGKYSHVPEVGNPNDADAFAILIMEMISSLQEKLLSVSQTLPADQSLRFLFLLNNTYFMWQQLHASPRLESHMPALTCKIDEHIRSYLQASWAPVLACLHDPTPLCLGRYSNSPLVKFKLQFQKTRTAQKLWRVPDPELRRKLRTVIIDKVNSGLTKYLEDYNIITPGVTPQEIEEILQETFEG